MFGICHLRRKLSRGKIQDESWRERGEMRMFGFVVLAAAWAPGLLTLVTSSVVSLTEFSNGSVYKANMKQSMFRFTYWPTTDRRNLRLPTFSGDLKVQTLHCKKISFQAAGSSCSPPTCSNPCLLSPSLVLGISLSSCSSS